MLSGITILTLQLAGCQDCSTGSFLYFLTDTLHSSAEFIRAGKPVNADRFFKVQLYNQGTEPLVYPLRIFFKSAISSNRGWAIEVEIIDTVEYYGAFAPCTY